jgi:hypothetical protein
VRIERAQRIFVVGGGQHDDRHRIERQRVERFEHREAAHLRHLHVEEHDVDGRARSRGRFHRAQRGFSAGARAHHLHRRLPLQQLHQPRPRGLLIVHDQHAIAAGHDVSTAVAVARRA